MSKEKLLEVRKAIKSRKPKFIAQDSHKKKTIPKKYVRPRGIQSKMRLKRGGHRKLPSPGYRSPAEIRGTTRKGLFPVNVSQVLDLEKINPEEQIAVITSQVGMRKRIEIIKKAAEKKIAIFNVKKPEEYLANAEKELADRKNSKVKKQAEEKKEEEKKTAKKDSKSIEEKVETEDKKKEEKKEKDKVLTKGK